MSAHTTLAERRHQAAAVLADTSLPNRRVEDWKYTDVSRILAKETVTAGGAANWRIDDLPEGVELVDLTKAPPAWVEHHLGVLGTPSLLTAASLTKPAGFALRVPAGARPGTVTVRISGNGHLRGLILAEEGARLHLREIAESDGAALRNVGLEILACPEAEISHLRLGERTDGVGYESIEVLLRDKAQYAAHFANFGAKLSRVDLHTVLECAAARVSISGVAVLGGTDHADVTTHIEHAAAGTSTQLFKYIVGGAARAVYQGRITVRKGADGTDSRQTAKAMLLDTRAEADLKPELLIFADDVKCAHGAAVGDFDPDALFYLQSRGLDENEARDLLLRAFLGEAIDAIAADDWRDEIWKAVEAALPAAMEKTS